MLIKSDPNCQADGLPHLSLGYWFRTILRKRTGDKISWGGKKSFSTFCPFSLLSFKQQVTCFQIGLKLNPKFQINQFLSEISYHTHKKIIWTTLCYSHISLLFCPVLFTLLPSFSYPVSSVKEMPKTSIRECAGV